MILLVLPAVGCSDNKKPEPEGVEKYCDLLALPHVTATELRALQTKAIGLFKERKPYRTTDTNRAVVNAASQLSVTAGTYALQQEKPALFPGQPKGMGFPDARTQLSNACLALPTKP